ncbi:hypothetical protein SPRG_01186 [Saprolegnia parasitica CBS 223.65]|uniref:Uncharacterized protein n=1 Tax=Saprolegnia parasitica (strain CBS 223.65) TaxID=695850 RepID=A0A067CWN8_SAPPC|nr:hypothetical protein SPRG_01186 [Saprolegnia parasitica CBS 223.65]KDO35119.1 hypothetical protein SPRG_01186 [Saprolegnia parasitica CBS 223.65]|eukprot:XP_012194768.1 hypothetical protein SPRG_01186 [Saprolegnia parasitica CBS 223.65]
MACWPGYALGVRETCFRPSSSSDADVDAALDAAEEKLQQYMEALVGRKAPAPWGLACKEATGQRASREPASPLRSVQDDPIEVEGNDEEEVLALELDDDDDEEDEDMEIELEDDEIAPTPDRRHFMMADDDDTHDTFDASFDAIGTTSSAQRTIQFFPSPIIETHRASTRERRSTPLFSDASPVVPYPRTIPEPMSTGSHMSLQMDDPDTSRMSLDWDSSLR